MARSRTPTWYLSSAAIARLLEVDTNAKYLGLDTNAKIRLQLKSLKIALDGFGFMRLIAFGMKDGAGNPEGELSAAASVSSLTCGLYSHNS